MDKRVKCKYGKSCFRRQPSHFIEFAHPFVEEIAEKVQDGKIDDVLAMNLDTATIEQAQCVANLLSDGQIHHQMKRNCSSPETGASASKRQKLHDVIVVETDGKEDTPITSVDNLSIVEKIDKSSCSYFLSSIDGIPETQKQSFSLTFSDTLDPSLGTLKSSVQFNFMVELGWLLAQYCYHKIQRKPLLVIYGAETSEMKEASTLVPTLKAVYVKPKYAFGHHHTKMAIFSYEDNSIRIVIHTGNLIESDWENRTQGLWISPKCPFSSTSIDSETGFQKDLIRYLEAYPVNELHPWIEKIRKTDMSAIKVCFIPSVPASHSGNTAQMWGHPYLTSILKKHALTNEEDDEEHGNIIIQCSSIGSLGPSSHDWLLGEIGYALSACHGTSKAQFPAIKVIYPCYNDVMSSLDGINGGGCLPYSRQGHIKQTWLSSFLHLWRSDHLLRTRAMPHIKTYARVSADWQRISWFILTSANLSKAAWGMKTKSNSLIIQSYEAGVLFLPKFINGSATFAIDQNIRLPYDVPPVRFGPNDQPWFIDHLR